jgi:hypothetical protein
MEKSRIPVGRSTLLTRVVACAGMCCAALQVHAASSICSGTRATTAAEPVMYSAFVVTDVSLAGRMYRSAEVTLSFRGNTMDIYKFTATAPDGGTGSGMCIDQGDATVTIRTMERTVKADFLPDQVFVSFDTEQGGIGFSSYTGPNGLEPVYPLGLLNNFVGPGGTVEQFTSDLFTPVNVSGIAWSCIGYPPLRNAGYCLDPAPYPLKTNRGAFRIYMPFQNLENGTICCDFAGSLNRGIFSVILGRQREE